MEYLVIFKSGATATINEYHAQMLIARLGMEYQDSHLYTILLGNSPIICFILGDISAVVPKKN